MYIWTIFLNKILPCFNLTVFPWSFCNLSLNDVGRNKFVGSVPTEIGILTNLTSLRLCKKQIGVCIGDTLYKMLIVSKNFMQIDTAYNI